MDLNLRFVRFFTVVARQENFGRAAIQLRLAQPTLSRYIKALENDLGVQLLERTSRGTHLTEAGKAFLPLAEKLLVDSDRAVTEARAVATPRQLTVGYVGGLIITPAVTHLRKHRPGIEIRTVHLHWSDAHHALLDHRADVVVARTPLLTEGLRVSVLYEEPRVLLVPLGHSLATMASVALDDFADEPLVGYERPDYDAFWRINPRPDGSAAPLGPISDLKHDKLESVAEGLALALAPSGPGKTAPRPDLVAIPIDGIEWSTVVIATRDVEPNALVRAFEQSAHSQLAGTGSWRATTPTP